MPNTQDLITFAMRVLPDPSELRQQLQIDPDAVTRSVFGDDGTKSITRALVGPKGDQTLLEAQVAATAILAYRRKLIQKGADALEEIQAKGKEARLTPSQSDGLEAIISAARPAILMHNDKFNEPPPTWKMILEPKRDQIQHNAKNVGRIRTLGDPQFPYWGTGFVVAQNVIMTNRHVAERFTTVDAGQKVVFLPGKQVRWNNVDEPDNNPGPELEITEVIGIHKQFDLALLRINVKSSSATADLKPLKLAAQAPGPLGDRQVYTVGYPAYDALRNDATVMRKVFADIYGVKRLQPGAVMAFYDEDSLFDHDCSTLGGNSGSCVVDLETNQVLGLHFEGQYMQYNRAIALWKLREDPLLHSAGVNFG